MLLVKNCPFVHDFRKKFYEFLISCFCAKKGLGKVICLVMF